MYILYIISRYISKSNVLLNKTKMHYNLECKEYIL
jgi:hypothetical protein